MPEISTTEPNDPGGAVRAADCMVSVRREARGIHDTVTVWINGQNVGTLVAGLGQGAALERLLQGTGPQLLDGGIGVSDAQLSEWRVIGSNWLDVSVIDTLGVTGLVGRIVLRLLDAVEVLKAQARADREVVVGARFLARLWREQEGFNAAEMDALCTTVEAHEAAEQERRRGR